MQPTEAIADRDADLLRFLDHLSETYSLGRIPARPAGEEGNG
jgi:hypothetical protein